MIRGIGGVTAGCSQQTFQTDNVHAFTNTGGIMLYTLVGPIIGLGEAACKVPSKLQNILRYPFGFRPCSQCTE